MASMEESPLRRGARGVVLLLELEPGDRLTGSIALAGQPEKRFSGWIELMTAVNAARAVSKDRSPS